jgi:phage repressor protein C with HTH and peptisase S24 domain
MSTFRLPPGQNMLSHTQLWAAIDGLAERHHLTASGLARKAGLDSTTFNPSKRVSPEGRQRWPSTESVAKILAATNTPIEEFVGLITKSRPPRRMLPLLGLAQAGKGRFFDNGLPTGNGWDEVAFPDIGDEQAYALEISGDSMLPLYRNGDIIIVSPNAGVRRGDRVVVRTVTGEVTVKELKRRTAKTVELRALNPSHQDRVLPLLDIAWMARVVWSSQ